jgi:hypothetical protein
MSCSIASFSSTLLFSGLVESSLGVGASSLGTWLRREDTGGGGESTRALCGRGVDIGDGMCDSEEWESNFGRKGSLVNPVTKPPSETFRDVLFFTGLPFPPCGNIMIGEPSSKTVWSTFAGEFGRIRLGLGEYNGKFERKPFLVGEDCVLLDFAPDLVGSERVGVISGADNEGICGVKDSGT